MLVVYLAMFVNCRHEEDEDDVLAQQIAHDRLAQPENAPDRLYSFKTAEGAFVRNIITSDYKEHIPHWFHVYYLAYTS